MPYNTICYNSEHLTSVQCLKTVFIFKGFQLRYPHICVVPQVSFLTEPGGSASRTFVEVGCAEGAQEQPLPGLRGADGGGEGHGAAAPVQLLQQGGLE